MNGNAASLAEVLSMSSGATPRQPPSVTLESVVVTRGDLTILNRATAHFPAGKVCAILGKAGSGKSMILKTAAGLSVFDSGKVLVGNQDLALLSVREERAFQRYSGFMFQDAALWANQTVYDNLGLPLAVHEPRLPKEWRDRRIKDIARLVGCADRLHIRPASLSMGEQKLAGLARALILDPPLYFMDEPTASLDDAAVTKVIGLLEELRRLGRTMLVVTHDPLVVAGVADYICVVSRGVVSSFGPVEDIAPLIGGSLYDQVRARRLTAPPADHRVSMP